MFSMLHQPHTFPLFSTYKSHFQDHFQEFIKDTKVLFRTSATKEQLIETFLESFPGQVSSDEYQNIDGYGMRQWLNCRCCKSFVGKYGGLVKINPETYEVETLWEFLASDSIYQEMNDNLDTLVKSCEITEVFVVDDDLYQSSNLEIGIDHNIKLNEDGTTTRFNHFSGTLSSDIFRHVRQTALRSDSVCRTAGGVKNFFGSKRNVLVRGLAEISLDAIDGVLHLISTNQLSEASPFEGAIRAFRDFLVSEPNDNQIWLFVAENPILAAFPNTLTGQLLRDLSQSSEVEHARLFSTYQRQRDPANYQQKDISLVTPAQISAAEKTVKDLGLENSLARKHANSYDLSISQLGSLYWVNRLAKTTSESNQNLGIFAKLKQEVSATNVDLAAIEKSATEITLADFLSNQLGNTTNLELLFSNSLISHLFSLIAPADFNAPAITKWSASNNFTWNYKGGLADSSAIREKVKSVGGKIDGDLGASLGWGMLAKTPRESGDDLDLWLETTDTKDRKVYFGHKVSAKTGAWLDVDMNAGSPFNCIDPVENITIPDASKLKSGETYTVKVNNFRRRSGGNSGFVLEFKLFDQVFSYAYDQPLSGERTVRVLSFIVGKDGKIEITHHLQPTNSIQHTQEVWNLQTNSWIPVHLITQSPNCWGESGIVGQEHIFFFLQGCQAEGKVMGMTQEFLRQDLVTTHSRTFQLLAHRMEVSNTDPDNQLSGVGFSQSKSGKVEFFVRCDGRVFKVVV